MVMGVAYKRSYTERSNITLVNSLVKQDINIIDSFQKYEMF